MSNAAASEQRAAALVVRVYATDYRLRGPAGWFARRGLIRDSSAAQWFTGASFIAPGGTLSGFEITGLGVLDLVPYRVQGDYELPPSDEVHDAVVRTQRAPSFWANSVAGTTVGLVPAPSTAPGALGTRLNGLLSRGCALGWIDNRGIGNSLSVKLNHAQRSIRASRRALGMTCKPFFMSSTRSAAST